MPMQKYLIKLLAIILAYFATGFAGLQMPAVGTSVTLIWLPTGIAVASLFRCGYRYWPAVSIASLAVNLTIGSAWLTCLGIAVGNTLAPLLTVFLLRQLKFSGCFEQHFDIALLALAAHVGMLVSASSGIAVLAASESLSKEFVKAWLCWWAGDSMGVIAAAPLLLVASRAEFKAIQKRSLEFASWLILTILVTGSVFVLNDNVGEPAWALAFVPLPLIAWATLRFSATGTSLAIIVISVGAVFGTSIQSGPFYRQEATQQVLLLWIYMFTIATLGWLTAALHFAQLKAVNIQRVLEDGLRAASLGVILTDSNRQITYVNEGFTRLTGYGPNELLGRNCDVLQGAKSDPATIRQMRENLNDGRHFDGAIINYRQDGTTFWNGLLIAPIFHEKGKKVGFLGIQRDITPNKEIEFALQDSELRYRQLFENNPHPMWVYDLETLRFLAVNHAAIEHYGYSRDEFLAMTIQEIRPAEDVPALKENIARVTSGLDKAGVWRHRNKAGDIIQVEITSHVTEFDDRRAELVLAFDVTDRIRLEEKIHATQLQLETLISNLPGMAYRCQNDVNWTMSYVSSGCEAVTGYHRDELEQNKRVTYADLVHPDDREWLWSKCQASLEARIPCTNTYRIVDKADQIRWVIERASGVYNEDGSVHCVDGFIQDITEARRIEEQVRASLREKEAMLKEIHHRVRNNLQIVTSLLNLQVGSLTDPSVLNALRESRNRIRSIALVHETLYQSSNLGTINLSQYVDALCGNLFRSYGNDMSQIQLQLDVSQTSLDLERAIPFGLVINELVSNALKYAFPAGRAGKVQVTFHTESAGQYTLRVADDGIGLPAGLDLTQLKSLGLQLVQDLIQQLSGTLTIAQGHNTEFCVSFPIRLTNQES